MRTSLSPVVVPGPRGYAGPGAGMHTYLQPADEFRGTSVQVCGLWPWAVGAGTPMIGVPLGRHSFTGATVCCDPISWFQRAHLISNPSLFVLGKPGLGKSTIVRRMVAGLAGQGVSPLVLGDLKPDYLELVKALGGQVISLGRGRGHINVLDPGEAIHAAKRLQEVGRLELAREVLAGAHNRRRAMVSALLTIQRQQPPSDREETIIDTALRVLDKCHKGTPVLADLLKVVQEGPTELRQVALDRGDRGRYEAIIENLEASLLGLVLGGKLGDGFSRPTTTTMRRDRAVVFDISGLGDADAELRAATLLACWSQGFGTVEVSQALADAGLEPRRHFFVVMDELWQVLSAGQGMVDRVNALTRLNRTIGVGQAMISHTMSDMEALASQEDAKKAAGFVERSGMVICAGLPRKEMPSLREVIDLSSAEEDLLTSWTDPPSWSADGTEGAPPGRGMFLIKVGGRPGIPLAVDLTSVELGTSDTNQRWHK